MRFGYNLGGPGTTRFTRHHESSGYAFECDTTLAGTHPPRVHNVERINRTFDRPHQLDCIGPQLVDEVLLPSHSDAMLASTYRASSAPEYTNAGILCEQDLHVPSNATTRCTRRCTASSTAFSSSSFRNLMRAWRFPGHLRRMSNSRGENGGPLTTAYMPHYSRPQLR